MSRILYVEDDESMVLSVKSYLCDQGYSVESTLDGLSAQQILSFSDFDALVLDWDLPGLAGTQICKSYRSKGGKASVLMLTGKSDLNDRIKGLDYGADDYLCKPFHLAQLSARLRALLRRHGKFIEDFIEVGDLCVDTSTQRCTISGKEAKLRPLEYRLLEFFMRNAGVIFSSDELLKQVWASDTSASSETVRVTIARLRRAIDQPDEQSHIDNKPGFGYLLKTSK